MDYSSRTSFNKYHSSESSSNPLEKAAFRIAQEMIQSPKFRSVISLYLVVIHFLLLIAILHYM